MQIDAKSISSVLADSRWIGACLARAQLALSQGMEAEVVARTLYESSSLTLRGSRDIVGRLPFANLSEFLDPRQKTGSAENPVTKLFPAAVTERQFLDEIERLSDDRSSVTYRDERFGSHSLVDFTLLEGELELPINVKNAGTRFENAASLVGLDPNDCIPIPAYKAYDAIEKVPNLLYAISVDYALLGKIESQLITRLSKEEAHVWHVLNSYAGSLIRDAEDRFVYSTVNRHWEEFSAHVALPVFRVISARKAIRVLQTQPKRTPGIGLRAWGTGASAEVNVHISITNETMSWREIHRRISDESLSNIINAVNRKKTEVVYDPEI
ncbi:MAG: hypothetical protein ABL888_16225 [Pirellulaceae bacterium]